MGENVTIFNGKSQKHNCMANVRVSSLSNHLNAHDITDVTSVNLNNGVYIIHSRFAGDNEEHKHWVIATYPAGSVCLDVIPQSV